MRYTTKLNFIIQIEKILELILRHKANISFDLFVRENTRLTKSNAALRFGKV